MRRRLILPGMLAVMFFAASPASAQWAAFHNWNFCSANALSVCMNFDLTRNGTTNQYRLLVGYVSSRAQPDQTGAMTSAGLYRDRRGVEDLNVTGMQILATTPTGFTWSIGSSQLGGDGPIVIEVAGNSNQGINNGLPVGGSVLIGFNSNNMYRYDVENLYARSHIQGYGERDCSLKPDSRAVGNLVDPVSTVDAACGTNVIPEPMTMVLLGSGLLGIGGIAVRRRRKVDELA